jgi:TolB-like protein/tetratricopeptide (TPR) repeat protein
MSPAGPSSLGEPSVLAPEQISLVRRHLEKILASHVFAGSRRTQDFLRLIVSHALEGDVDNLRERMIGAEMFGRPVSYDTGSDSVVRVRASEVRKKLAQFYSESKEEKTEVRIELPSGSYVPRFHFEPREEPAPAAAFTSEHSASLQKQKNGSAAAAAVQSQSERSRYKRLLTPRFAAAALFAVCLVVLAGIWAARKWMNGSNSPKGIHSIAILPLENLSGSPDQNYFADGMTEELINDLGQVSTLRVISLTSSMSYKGTKKTLPEIAHELSVDGVVEGGVLREGNQVRVSVQLIDARNDRPVWAHTYIRDLSGVSSWQGEVAQAIADEVSSDVTPQQQAQLTRKTSVDPAAQDDYLHGILLREADNCKDAISDFNRAIEKDPSYALAHSALASCYGMLGESGRMPYEQAFGLQKTEALKAIGMDDYLSEAHAELANTAMTLDWDWPVAEAEFHRALELNPNSATNHEKYAFYLVRTGHPNEALAEIQRSVDLDPVSGSTFHAEGFVYYFSHQYDQALDVARTVRGLKINLSDWNLLTGASYAEKGMYNDAIEAFLKSGTGAYSLGHLGNAYARAGRKQAAQRLISQLEEDVRTQGVGRYEIALVYAGLGDSRDAFKWLDDAYRSHDVGLVYLKVDPCLDSLRADPRFEDLVRRVGLAK